jgi:hypothetical protein
MAAEVTLSGTDGRHRRRAAADDGCRTPSFRPELIVVDDQTVRFLLVSSRSGQFDRESLIGRLSRGTWLVAGLTALAAVLAGGW